jgi:hypothetical protein
MAAPTTLFPTQEREVYIAKEASPGTIPASVGVPVPVTNFKPSDKPMWIMDESEQGSMGDMYGVYEGPLIAGFDIGGHITGDTFPYFLYNLLGDYTVTGAVNTTTAVSAVTSGAMAAGLSAIPVVSGGASFTNGMWIELVDTGSPAAPEVVQVGTGSTSTSIVLVGSTRFPHATAMTVQNSQAPYTHVFSVVNSGGAGYSGGAYVPANGAGQPVTHCITDRTGIPATGLAAQYAYSCMSEITITGNAEKLLDWTGKAVCQTRQIAGSATYTSNVSSVNPYPSWRSTTGLGGPGASFTFTATNATPCVFTAAAFVVTNGMSIQLAGTVPTGFTAATTYYVVNALATSAGSTFNLAATSGGSAINSTSTGSGTVSGTGLVKYISEWSVTLGRAVKALNTNQGAQTPYVIARGKQSVSGKHTIGPAIDESALVALLANTQPQLQYVASNGLTGANLVQVQIDIGLGAYDTADLQDGGELFGYEVPWKAPHTAAAFAGPQGGALYGASGGKGACKIAITNAIPSY